MTNVITKISKKLSFGKVAYSGKTKANLVEISIELRNKENAVNWEDFSQLNNVPELSICGSIWDNQHYDIECGGQCLDTIKEYLPHNKQFARICEIWEQYHLNDMKAGSKKQTEFLDGLKATGWVYSYDSAKDKLKEAGLLMDKGYIYGSAWLYCPIPTEIINEITNIINK